MKEGAVKVKKLRKEPVWVTILCTAALILMALVMVFPLLLVLNVSLKTQTEFNQNPSGIFDWKPIGELFSNYSYAFERMNIFGRLLYTVAMTVGSALISCVVVTLVAYPLARNHFKGSGKVFGFILISMFFPGSLVANIFLVQNLGLYNNPVVLIDGYADLPAFEDVHSSTAFEFGDRDPADVLGFVHAGGQYNFTEQPYLTEGANLIARDIGSHVIKLFLGSDIADQYSFNETWGSHDSLADLVQEDEIDAVFSRADLSTYIIVTYEMDRLQWDSATAVSQSELERVQKEFSDLTTHLIRAYNDTGKTFVLQNWEGDNELREALAKTTDETTEQTIIDNYIAYNNARQAGITAAREALFATDDYANINVYGALEINYISYDAPEKKLVDYVVPHSDADLFSFSDWSTSNANLAKDLAYYLSKINENEDRQGENAATMNDIYLGEYGRKESTAGEENQFSYAVETAKIAVNAGVRWVCYWTLMCNERTEASTSRPVNSDMEGFWLIKPDGTITKTFWYFTCTSRPSCPSAIRACAWCSRTRRRGTRGIRWSAACCS